VSDILGGGCERGVRSRTGEECLVDWGQCGDFQPAIGDEWFLVLLDSKREVEVLDIQITARN
jgi:hypothetical protein